MAAHFQKQKSGRAGKSSIGDHMMKSSSKDSSFIYQTLGGITQKFSQSSNANMNHPRKYPHPTWPYIFIKFNFFSYENSEEKSNF